VTITQLTPQQQKTKNQFEFFFSFFVEFLLFWYAFHFKFDLDRSNRVNGLNDLLKVEDDKKYCEECVKEIERVSRKVKEKLINFDFDELGNWKKWTRTRSSIDARRTLFERQKRLNRRISFVLILVRCRKSLSFSPNILVILQGKKEQKF
jgi:hypothetical protein